MPLLRTIATAVAAFGAVAAASILPAAAIDISGAGATFPYPIYAKWADTYKKETGVGLNYQSIGSGGGIKQIQAKTVVFGATDAPLSGADLTKDGLVQFPMVMGGIVPVVNLDGISPGSLVIDGPTLGKIFLGQVKSWDDAAIKALNPGVTLPKQAIAARRSISRTISPRSARTGSRRSAKPRPLSGRSASAPAATKASPTTWRRRRAPSAMSSMPTPSRTS
jgi:ABC-type phosphate transport system substrate-binding protein